jgi:hypothetical protein
MKSLCCQWTCRSMQLHVLWACFLVVACRRAHAARASGVRLLSVCHHQVMEAATVLLSPEVCLDPSLPPEQRAVADTPPLPEVRTTVLLLSP